MCQRKNRSQTVDMILMTTGVVTDRDPVTANLSRIDAVTLRPVYSTTARMSLSLISRYSSSSMVIVSGA